MRNLNLSAALLTVDIREPLWISKHAPHRGWRRNHTHWTFRWHTHWYWSSTHYLETDPPPSCWEGRARICARMSPTTTVGGHQWTSCVYSTDGKHNANASQLPRPACCTGRASERERETERGREEKGKRERDYRIIVNFEGEIFCRSVENGAFKDKAFIDCLHLIMSRNGTCRPVISWRRLLHVATIPWHLPSFLPPKYPSVGYWLPQKSKQFP